MWFHQCSSKTNFHEFNFWKRSTKQMILEVRNAAIICIKRFRASVHKLCILKIVCFMKILAHKSYIAPHNLS